GAGRAGSAGDGWARRGRAAPAAGPARSGRAGGLATSVPAPGPATSARVGGSWPSQFAQVLAEILSGSRPAKQLTPWTTEQARKRISQLGPMLATTRQPRVRRVI